VDQHDQLRDGFWIVLSACGREIEMSRMSEIYIEVYEALERYGYDISIADIAGMLNVPDEWVEEVFEQLGIEDGVFGDELQDVLDRSGL
jgi:hypothetical protein